MAILKDIKFFEGGGMDNDSAIEYRAKNDYGLSYNIRTVGTQNLEGGNITSIESTELVVETTEVPAGVIKGIGMSAFDDIQKSAIARYNSFGNNQILLFDYITNEVKSIYTDKTDSGGEVLLPFNPENYIKFILIDETYLIWVGTDLEVGYTNLNTLASGGYGTVLWEDLSLLKPQCLIPITGTYGSDSGQPANYLFGNLPQFNVQYVNADFNYSTWSTWSKRIVPYQENTPILGSDVTQNNYIVVSVNIGSIRATSINIACRFGTDIFSIIKSVDRVYVVALPNTSVDVNTEIYEAYDPSTNLYSFAFYNNTISIPVPATQTDQFYSYIWPSNALEKANGNIIALADWKILYDRPQTNVTVGAIGYNPNIDIPSGTNPDPLVITQVYPGASGSGAGDHKRIMTVGFRGIPKTGDQIIIILADIRNATNTQPYGYTIPSSQDGDLAAVMTTLAGIIPNSSLVFNTDGSIYITFIGPPYFGLQTALVQLFFAGAAVANSIPTILDNTSYQLALSYRDYKARPFPLCTGNSFITPTPSYAQVNGQAVELTWRINDAAAPDGAVDYQWLTTKPPINSVLDVLGTPLKTAVSWNAYTNTPTLAPNVGTVGDVFQITTPSNQSNTGHYTDLGNGASYNTGDYVVYNGQSWLVLPKEFGNLTATGNIIAFNLNPLNLFNSQYAEVGVETVLSYDFTVGDRCTLHYYVDGGTKVFINNPCVNLSVFGYDAGNYIVKVEKSATFDESVLVGKNVFLRLYTPAAQTQTVSSVQNATVWYEIGERFTITNGRHDVLNGVITDGGAYYKTRQYDDALEPYTNPPLQTLSTDFNYSDFYPSAFSSFGRPRTYSDQLEKTERKANIITSQSYILGSKNNGLTTFYQEDIYGDANGQTSSSYGAIQVLWQRGQVLLAIQELNIFYIPVNEAYTVLNDELTGQSISEKLLNNGRYETKGIGIGTAKEAFTYNENTGWMIDPNRSEPFELTIGGVNSISGKMSKYFKTVFSMAYAQGKKIVLFYNRYYDEVVVCVEADGGVLTLYPFSPTDWQFTNSFNIAPTDVTSTGNGTHSTASYDDTTGLVTYTPTSDYIGADRAPFTFTANATSHTVNNCLNWIAGTTTVNDFFFVPQVDVAVSTPIYSNTISVLGINIAVPISITGGQYSINGGSWTSSAGSVNNGDIVQVRQTSSSGHSVETNAVLTISGTTGTFSVTTIGTEDVDPFSFTAQVHVAVSTVTTSNTITITGNTLPSPISITGGTYSVNGGSFVSSSGTVNAGDTVRVRITSSASFNTLVSCTLNVDSQSGAFNVTTGTEDVSSFAFTAVTGQPISTNIESNTITITGNTLPSPISITGGTYSVNGGGYTSSSGHVNAGDMVKVRVASSASTNTLTSCTLTIDSQSSTFNVTTQFVNIFPFTAQTNVAVSTLCTSNTDALSGTSVIPLPISVTGGEYSINGGSFTSASGTINIGDTITCRQTSSASFNTTTICEVTILDRTDGFNVTTGTTVVNTFSFTAQTGVALSTLIISNTETITGNTLPAPISIVGGDYSINGGGYTSSSGTINSSDTVTVRVLSSAFNSTETHADLTISSETETFSVTTLSTPPPPDSSISIHNGSTDYDVTSTTLTEGPTDYSFGEVLPGNTETEAIDSGTYRVDVALTTMGASGCTVTINGTPVSITAPGGTAEVSGVVAPITVEITEP